MAKSLLVALITAIAVSTASAKMPLDLIQYYYSDIYGSALMWGLMSPGDLDGDNHSELFAYESSNQKRVLVLSGGILPDTTPVMIINGESRRYNWLPDINGDGIPDFAILEHYQDTIEIVDIWFGGDGFLQKTEPDLKLPHSNDTIQAFGYTTTAGDVNGDGQNDIVIAAINGEIAPYDGRFYIYYGGDQLDTSVDATISIYDIGNGYNNFWIGTGLGDVNGDGLLDFAYSGTKNTSPGYVSVIFGSVPMDTLPDLTFWDPMAHLGSSRFGWVIEPLGDLNKDGYDDFAVGGSSVWPCVYYGGSPFDTVPVYLGDTTDVYTMGDRIANIGDIDHDGWDDIAVGFTSYGLGSGIVYVYFGSEGVMDGDIDLVLSHNDTYPYSDAEFGEDVGPAGDFDGDGIDDMAVSGKRAGPESLTYVYVYAGSDTLSTAADEIDDDAGVPRQYNILEQSYPNPFNSETTIRYSLLGHSERHVELSIYNMLGEKIRTLRDRIEGGGVHAVEWDGTDNNGDPVASGVYFYVLSSDKETLSKKLTLIK